MCFHVSPRRAAQTAPYDISSRFAHTRVGSSECLIARTQSSVRRANPCRSPTAYNPFRTAWRAFCTCVSHSKLDMSLLALLPSMWLTTCRSVGGGPRKAMATSRWTVRPYPFLSLYRIRKRYPSLLILLRMIFPTCVRLPRAVRFTRPRSLTA